MYAYYATTLLRYYADPKKAKEKENQPEKGNVKKTADAKKAKEKENQPDKGNVKKTANAKKAKANEDQPDNDVKITGVTVRSTKQTSYATRIYDKKQACYFCNKLCAKITRHLQRHHSNESEVAAALARPKNSNERKKALRKIQLKGNYHHNAKVIACGQGELIVRKRPSQGEAIDAKEFLPCPYCLAFIRKNDLWRHRNICPYKEESEATPDPNGNPDKNFRSMLTESKLLLLPFICPVTDKMLNELVFAKMIDDDIAFICKRDELIQMLGSSLIEKAGESKAAYVSSKMREVGRLLKVLNAEEEGDLKTFLNPTHFDLVIRSVRKLCGFHRKENQTEVEIPSLALKLGHNLNKCAQIYRGIGLREKDEEVIKNTHHFLELMKYEWSDKVSSCSLTTLSNGKSSEELIPLTSDLLKVRKHAERRMEQLTKEVKTKPSEKNWTDLAQLTEMRLITFNKRRSGEASRMLLKDYTERPSWKSGGCEAIKSTLNPLERHLCESLDLVQVIGKRGRKVPVILTKDVKMAIDVLIATREQVGVARDNKYLFARANQQSRSYMRGWDCIRNVISEVEGNLERPDLITSTKLRKYVATVSQVGSFTENNMDWLARHLGHDIRIHRDYYRLHSSTLELAKVSKLLLAIDAGNINNLVGKDFSDIDIDDISETPIKHPTSPTAADDDEEDDDNDDYADDAGSAALDENEIIDKGDDGDYEAESSGSDETEDDGFDETPKSKSKLSKSKTTKSKTSKKTVTEDSDDSYDETPKSKSKLSKSKTTKSKTSKKTKNSERRPKRVEKGRRPWTKEETEAILASFDRLIRDEGKAPNKLACENCLRQAGAALAQRDWKAVKYQVKFLINKRKKDKKA